jgi:hypothetical protein
MITGKDLKRMVEAIPDDAIVMVNNNQYVSITNIVVSTFPWLNASLNLTPGFSITKDSVLEDMFRHPHMGSSIPDAETR